jgi:hypothetical protein
VTGVGPLGCDSKAAVLAAWSPWFSSPLLEPVFRRLAICVPRTSDYASWRFWLRPVAYALAVCLVFMFDESRVAFIYFQF